MERRDFIKKIGIGGLAVGALAACDTSKKEVKKVATPDANKAEVKKAVAPVVKKKTYNWKMVTTWPKNFPGLGTGANYLAETITKMSQGELNVKIYGAGELVGALEIFDAVSKGTAQMGHSAAYYWKGKVPAAQFMSATPFGLNANEMIGWIENGGGQKIWDEIYAPFNLRGFAAGTTGVQMGGWFQKDINSVDDFKGLKMRMPGLGGEVIKELGAVPISLPGGQIFQALETGSIDATEWVGPYNDLAFGFHKICKNYYFPGWHEPGTVLEAMVNKQALEALPKHLQTIVATACRAAYSSMHAEYTARNNNALQVLVNEHGVKLKKFPDALMKKLADVSDEVVANASNVDPLSKKVFDSYIKFRNQSNSWTNLGEVSYLNARNHLYGNTF